jgi:hypothetical protein
MFLLSSSSSLEGLNISSSSISCLGFFIGKESLSEDTGLDISKCGEEGLLVEGKEDI